MNNQATNCELIPDCCRLTVSRVQRAQRRALCPVCGTEYAPDEATAIERPALLPAAPREATTAPCRPSRPSLVPDGRVSVVHNPTPTGTRFTRPSFSDDQVARVLRLLEELQVDVGDERAGGKSWAPPSDVAAQRYDRVLVQTSVREPGGPNLAVLLDAVDERRPTVGARIDHFRSDPGGREGETVASVLHWLRENGSRAELARDGRAELTRIYGALGYLYASMKTRARYDADERVKREAAPVLGRTLVHQAMDAWWGT